MYSESLDFDALDHGWCLVPQGVKDRRTYAERLISESGIVSYYNFYGLDLLAELLDDRRLAKELIIGGAHYWLSVVTNPMQPLGYPTAVFSDRGTTTGYVSWGLHRGVRLEDHERWRRHFYNYMLSFSSYQVVLIDWRHSGLRSPGY